MTCWLYQMSSKKWPYEQYTSDVCEGSPAKDWFLCYMRKHSVMPEQGDIIVLFYCKSRAPRPGPGIYGWGIISRREGNKIDFYPEPPSNRLKVNPIWDKEIAHIIGEWRGKNWRPTTFQDVTNSFERLKRKIDAYV